MSSPLSRDPLIDIFKALACALIIWHHLAFYGPMSDAVLPLFPRLLSWLYDYGRRAGRDLAVRVSRSCGVLRAWWCRTR